MPSLLLGIVSTAISTQALGGNDFDQSLKEREIRLEYRWEPISSASDIVAPGGAHYGVSNGALIMCGGERRESGGSEVYVGDIYLYDFEQPERGWRIDPTVRLPEAIAFGGYAARGDWLYLTGGMNSKGTSDQAARLRYDRTTDTIEVETIPSLPRARAFCAADFLDGTLYVAGGVSAPERKNELQKVIRIDTEAGDGGAVWEVVDTPYSDSMLSPVLIRQNFQRKPTLFLFGGLTIKDAESSAEESLSPARKAWRWDSREETWLAIQQIPADRIPVTRAISSGVFNVLMVSPPFSILGGFPAYENPQTGGNGSQSSLFCTVTDTWISGVPLPGDARILDLVKDQESDGKYLLASDSKEGVKLFKEVRIYASRGLHWLDYSVLVAYFATLVLIGYYFFRIDKTTDDYFRAGKRMPSWAAAISIIGSGLSAITFLSIPAIAFAANWNYYAFQIQGNLCIWIAGLIIIPIYYRLNLTTIPEYMYHRFGYRLRYLSAIMAPVMLIVVSGAIILLPSMVLSVVTGINLTLCIVTIGAFATIYTVFGGLEAVIWTDVLQVLIMVLGVIICIITALGDIHVGLVDAFQISMSKDKLELFNFDFDLTTITAWALLVKFPILTVVHLGDQVMLQRFICTPNIKQAKRTVLYQLLAVVPIVLLFYVFGTSMFLFYESYPDRLNPAIANIDEVAPWFIVNEVPAGIVGLLLGSIFAATMSTLDTRIHSTATIVVNDLVKPLSKRISDSRALLDARAFVCLFGVLITAMAVWFAQGGIKSAFDLVFDIIAVLGGGGGGIFLALFSTRTNENGVLLGWLVTIIVNVIVKFSTDYHFIIIGIISFVVSVTVSYLSSFALPQGERKSLEGLTVWTPSKGV